jgi:hypothetical protein
VQVESQQEAKQEKLWLKIIRDWPEYQLRRPDKIRDYIHIGIPDGVRAVVWRLLIDPAPDPSAREPVASLCQRGRPRVCNVIEADLTRTLATNVALELDSIRDSLRTVLHAYSNIDPELGYVQGMSLLAAMFLLYMDETSAFWSFERLMNGPIHAHRLLFVSRFAGLNALNQVWAIVLAERYPDVARHLTACGVEPIMYTTGWFLTAFMSLGLRPDVRLRIFDRFLAFGCRALLSFGLVIVSQLKAVLATQDAVACVIALQKPDEEPAFQDWRRLMVAYEKKWISAKEYRAFFKKARVGFIF